MAKSRDERLKAEGYRKVEGRGYSVKVNKPRQGFDSAQEAADHYDSQKSSGDLIDNSISQMVSGGGK